MVHMNPPTILYPIIAGKVLYAVGYLPPFLTTRLLKSIAETSAWRQEKLRMGGVPIPFPRLIAWHGDPGVSYRYSGTKNVAAGWTEPLLEVREYLKEHFGQSFGGQTHGFNGVLLNWYRSGKDSIGRHSDDEGDLVPEAPIVTISLGATRTMRFRPKGGSASDETHLKLSDGSLMVMYGDCQKTHTHEIRKEPTASGERISLTFRVMRT